MLSFTMHLLVPLPKMVFAPHRDHFSNLEMRTQDSAGVFSAVNLDDLRLAIFSRKIVNKSFIGHAFLSADLMSNHGMLLPLLTSINASLKEPDDFAAESFYISLPAPI